MPKIAVESWDPSYGTEVGSTELLPSDATVDAAVELDPQQWRPLAPAPDAAAASVVFIDGVRRIDAFIWVTDDDGTSRPGICASYAAGCVRAAERATVVKLEVRRGLFTSASMEALDTRAGPFAPHAVAGDAPAELSNGLQHRLGDLEIEVATALGDGAELVVIDGPLHGRQAVPSAIGYVKTHRVSYLPAELTRTIQDLAPGERTPIFLTTTSWSRHSFYLRLPGPVEHPWSGIVRIEISADRPFLDVRGLAERAAATLPRFASEPHKEPRAPQNLFPIAGLERELRRRLGDAAFVHRALRAAAAAL